MAGERTLPGLGLTAFWNLGDSTWKPGMDTNIQTLSAITQFVALSRTTSLPGTPSDGDIYIVPNGDANGNQIAIRDAGAWYYVLPFEGAFGYVIDEGDFVYYDGSFWARAPRAYDVIGGFRETPISDEVVDSVPIVRNVSFAANFLGSIGYVGQNPSASFVLSVQDDGVEIGSVTISTGGTFTFLTTGNTAKTVAEGSIITFVAPTIADGAIQKMALTLKGNIA